MAGVAIHGSVRTNERKAILVILDGLHGHVPALNRMTLLAIRSHLAAVDIGVAIRAFRSHIGEDQFHVAIHALDFFVHAAERIAGLIMIEFRDAADRFPTRESMAIFAGNGDVPVRILGGILGRRSALALREGDKRKAEKANYG
jgi:hypothetical protein